MTFAVMRKGERVKEIFENNWPCLQCGQCKYFRVGADREASICKRIDHKHIKFATPWFKSYDCGQFAGNVCRDFEPSDTIPWLKEHWRGWDDYWDGESILGKVWLILDDDKSVRYAVLKTDFVNNTFLNEDGSLKWVEKEYYKRSRQTPIGYLLIHERK